MSFSSFQRPPILRSRSHTGLLPITTSGSGSLSRYDSRHGSLGSFGRRRGGGGACRAVLVLAALALLGGGGFAVFRLGGLGGGGGDGSPSKRGMREQRKPSDHALHGHLETDPHMHLRHDEAHLHAQPERGGGVAAAHREEQGQQHADPHLLGHHLEHAVHQDAGLHVEAGAHHEQQQQHVEGGAAAHDAHQQHAQQQQQNQQQPQQQHDGPPSLYESGLSAVDIHGNVVHLSDLRGKATIIVNVASKCGYTESNYKGLQGVYDRYHEHGLEILAFPCNQFGAQEPGTLQEIYDFVHGTYQTTFTMMAKVDVNGQGQHPVFEWLKAHAPAAPGRRQGEDIHWNFEKFVLDKWGVPVKRLGSDLEYRDIEMDVYNELIRQYP